MTRETGKWLQRDEHISQSVVNILTTPLGSRVCRRDYGSRLFQLVDRPINASLVGDAVAAAADALHRWEPRIAVDRVTIDPNSDPAGGRLVITVEGRRISDGQAFRLENLVIG